MSKTARLLLWKRSAVVIVRFKVALFSALVWLSGCGGGSMSTPTRHLMSLTVQPTSADAVAPSGALPFTATGTFNQAPMEDPALSAQWSSSDSAVATVDAHTGMATCVAAGGPVIITASSGGKTGTGKLTCLSASPGATGQCVYICGSTRCGALSGYCSYSDGAACHQAYDPGSCPVGKPANSTGTDGCGAGVDTSRSCVP